MPGAFCYRYRDGVKYVVALANTLGELRRGGTFSRIPLRGLTPDEVRRMMSAIAGREVPFSLSEAVHRQTEGNPLFIQEVLRYLVEEGLLTREGKISTTGGNLTEKIPEGLRDVIGKRLTRPVRRKPRGGGSVVPRSGWCC